MFVLDGAELVYLVCRGELDIVRGNELFGVLKCRSCSSFYPMSNYFPEIPDLRPRRMGRISMTSGGLAEPLAPKAGT